jgi:hypothetical protein
MFAAVQVAMAVLFAFGAAVQYNDPDPLRWMAIYAAASVLSAWAAVRGHASRWATLTIAGVALVWSVALLLQSAGLGVFAHMFDAWEMKSVPVEEAREATGLMIIAAWMIVLALFSHSTSSAT